MDQHWLALWQEGLQTPEAEQKRLAALLETNEWTWRYGLSLGAEEGRQLLEERSRILKEQGRIEPGIGILPGLIREFCDSDYLDQNSYVDTLVRLQEIFYRYQNEMQEEMTDEELLHLMKELFELRCRGDLDDLEESELYQFAQSVRIGCDGYRRTEGYGEYGRFGAAIGQDEEWDPVSPEEL